MADACLLTEARLLADAWYPAVAAIWQTHCRLLALPEACSCMLAKDAALLAETRSMANVTDACKAPFQAAWGPESCNHAHVQGYIVVSVEHARDHS